SILTGFTGYYKSDIIFCHFDKIFFYFCQKTKVLTAVLCQNDKKFTLIYLAILLKKWFAGIKIGNG
ncbi:MAG: hypothetical protein PWP57_810, partial [Candidatus Atribacteria bacterium]|nr:hypothetical protein [Candidatus Atribacteria bacterium]